MREIGREVAVTSGHAATPRGCVAAATSSAGDHVGAGVDTSDFRRIFEPDVRCLVDWPRLEEHCHVSLELITAPEELGALSTVWYVRDDDRLGGWQDQHAVRVTVNDAARRTDFPSRESAGYVERIQRGILAGDHPRVWVTPAFRTQTGETIILDGNHRAVALLMSGAPIALFVAVAQGLDDARVFPDLLHERADRLTATEWGSEVRVLRRHFGLADSGSPGAGGRHVGAHETG